MKKMLWLLIALMALPLSVVCAETVPEDWFALSCEDTVLTVWLPGVKDDGRNWRFEISDPDALELITHEVIGDEPDSGTIETTYAASFMSTACAENSVLLSFRYACEDAPEEPAETRALELSVSADNVISVVSVLPDPDAVKSDACPG